VTLTVTDNQGGTGTAAVALNPTAPASGDPFARDSFARTLSSGWGTADTGGSWTLSGVASKYAVGTAAGTMIVKAGETDSAVLQSVSSRDTDLQVTLSVDRIATGNGTSITLIGRRLGINQEYRARLRALPNGSAGLTLSSLNGSATETTLKPEVLPSGLTLAGGAAVTVRLQVTGTAPTTVRVKAWKTGTAEPPAWQLTVTDSAAALQAAGSVGLTAYVSSGSTVSPVTVRVSEFSARPVGAP
jgi:hypothetical protein